LFPCEPYSVTMPARNKGNAGKERNADGQVVLKVKVRNEGVKAEKSPSEN